MQTLIVVRESNYFSFGKDLAEARKNYKRYSGKFPSSKASILAFTGTDDELNKVEIDNMDGNIRYPKDLPKVVIQ